MTDNSIAFENLSHIFLTHRHPDHIGALNNLLHQMLVQARLIRKEAIEATRAGNDGEAQTKLETLTSMLSTIQSTLQEYTDGEQ